MPVRVALHAICYNKLDISVNYVLLCQMLLTLLTHLSVANNLMLF